MGPSLLCAVTQDTAECEVQQVGSSVVCHAGQPLGLQAQTNQQAVLVLGVLVWGAVDGMKR